LETWEPSQHPLVDTGKPRKTCVEVAEVVNFARFKYEGRSKSFRPDTQKPRQMENAATGI